MIPFQHGVFATSSGAASGFEAIATVTATGGETSLTFSSIPQGYASLQIRGISRTTGAYSSGSFSMIFNSDGAAHYSEHYLGGNGSATQAAAYVSDTASAVFFSTSGANAAANIFGAFVIDIHDYASTTRNKTTRALSGVELNTTDAQSWVSMCSSSWMSTTAITSITLKWATFAAGSTFALYGIKAAA